MKDLSQPELRVGLLPIAEEEDTKDPKSKLVSLRTPMTKPSMPITAPRKSQDQNGTAGPVAAERPAMIGKEHANMNMK